MTPDERLNTYIVELTGEAPDYAPIRAVIETTFLPCSVTFYDKRFFTNTHGQHIARYRLDTLLEIPAGQGLDMMGGVAAWKISAHMVTRLREVMIHAANGRIIACDAS